MVKKGKRIWVRASKSLGSPRIKATVQKVLHQPGEVPQYPDGLIAVLCDDENPEPEVLENGVVVEMIGTTVDFKGYVYSGPPLDGFLVQFP